MAAKRIQAVADPNQSVYAVIRRDSDGYLLDDADGSFALAPADFALQLPEDAIVKGLYWTLESRTVWGDGGYTLIPYLQIGGAPAIGTDPPGEAEQIQIQADFEVTVGTVSGSITFLVALLSGVKRFMKDITLSLEEVLKQIQIVYGQVIDLEKRIRREQK
jgi:hypothetical protein